MDTKEISGKVVSIVAVAAAVIVAAWAAMRVTDNKAMVARAQASSAASRAEAARAEEEAQISAAKAAERTEAANAAALKKAEVDKVAAEANAEAERSAAKRAADERAKAEADRDAARAAAAEASADAEAEQARASAAKAAAEQAGIEAKAAERERAASLRIAELEAERIRQETARAEAEARTLELRRMDLEEIERQLIEVKRDLDEREAALHPEKTIKDLISTSEVKLDGEEGPSLQEEDLSIPAESRSLLRARRAEMERLDAISALARSNVVARLERMYTDAIREDRVVDADFYRKELKRLYPDWVYAPPKEEESKKEEETK